MKKILLSIIILSLLCGCSTEKVKDEVHTVTLSYKNRKQTLRYHLNGGKIIKNYQYKPLQKKNTDEDTLIHPILKKKGVVFLGWTSSEFINKYIYSRKDTPLFRKKSIDYYAVYGKFIVEQKGNKVHFRVENIPYSNYFYYYYCISFNRKRKTVYDGLDEIFFETGVHHFFPPKDAGMKSVKGSITKKAVDYKLELKEKGTFYYAVFVDDDTAWTIQDADAEYEQVNADGPYLEGKITIK